MKYRYIARELYKRTREQPHFTVNDLRKHRFNELFKHHNQIGHFFGVLGKEKLAMVVGFDEATHVAAKGRWVRRWRWTEKAHALFGLG